ncbi:MAG TPA: DUF2797 domain-containing protein [Flavobacterium sp.]|nr:DUF2797 domain-containing protein [Flavobacterium sp.]
MTVFEEVLVKMKTEFLSPIQYYLCAETSFLNVNQLIDKKISVSHIGYKCLNCRRTDIKIFRQGFCYDCFQSSPQVGDWIMRPELSKAHLGIEDRDLEYETQVQLQPHAVYLATSSDVKVGVTRKTQIPTRWIDQGASKAIVVAEVPNRYLAGIAEVALKNHFTDKTNWRKMLQNQLNDFDLEEARKQCQEWLPQEVRPYFSESSPEIYELNYPVEQFSTKINSLNLEKMPEYSGRISGIKGQYILFEDGTVFNVRSHEGYVTRIELLA